MGVDVDAEVDDTWRLRGVNEAADGGKARKGGGGGGNGDGNSSVEVRRGRRAEGGHAEELGREW